MHKHCIHAKSNGRITLSLLVPGLAPKMWHMCTCAKDAAYLRFLTLCHSHRYTFYANEQFSQQDIKAKLSAGVDKAGFSGKVEVSAEISKMKSEKNVKVEAELNSNSMPLPTCATGVVDERAETIMSLNQCMLDWTGGDPNGLGPRLTQYVYTYVYSYVYF